MISPTLTSTLDIVTTFKEMYIVDTSPALISRVNDVVLEWQNRPLADVYPIVYLDGIVVRISQDNHVTNKTACFGLGVNIEERTTSP